MKKNIKQTNEISIFKQLTKRDIKEAKKILKEKREKGTKDARDSKK